MKKHFKKIIILFILVAVFVILRFSPLGEIVNLNRLIEGRDRLKLLVEDRFLLIALVYIFIYIISVALSIPGASVLTITGGFLFGPIFGTLFVNIGATTGAVLIFLISRYLIAFELVKIIPLKSEKFTRLIFIPSISISGKWETLWPNDWNFKIISWLSSNGLVNKICILFLITIIRVPF